MIAIISGQAGLAVVLEGAVMTAYSVEDAASPELLPAHSAPSLFNGATDVTSVDVPDHAAARSLLMAVWSRDRLLQMLLILLRRDAARELRHMAAEVAEELFQHADAKRLVLNRLYSHPLTEDADVAGAITIAESVRARTTGMRLVELRHDQPSIERVSTAWNTVLRFMPDRNRGGGLRRALEASDVFYRLGRAADARQVEQFASELSLQRLPYPLTAEIIRHLTSSQRRALHAPRFSRPTRTARDESLGKEAALLVDNLPTIDRIVVYLGRKHRIPAQDLEDLAGSVKLALVQDDYAILRKFEGRSSLTTYLTTVINRLLMDNLRHEWGRWRPSAEAKRMGDDAIQLERLISRDGCSFDEASKILIASSKSITATELEGIYARLPTRLPRRRLIPLSFDIVDPKPLMLDEVVANEIGTVLTTSLNDLTADDRLLLQMRFWEEQKLSEMAGVLHLQQKKVYKRIDGVLRKLRRRIENKGVHPEEVSTILSHSETEIALPDPFGSEGLTFEASRLVQSLCDREIN